MLKGTVILQYIDKKTGKVLHRIKKTNFNTPAGLDLYWRFFTSQVTEPNAADVATEFRLRNSRGANDPFSAARLNIQQFDPNDASEYIKAANVNLLDTGFPRLVIVDPDDPAKVIWRWTDDDSDPMDDNSYIPTRLNFSRNDVEGTLAQITAGASDNWPRKEEGVELQVTWEASLEARAGTQAGGQSDNVIVNEGLQEFLRPLVQDVIFPLKLSALSGRLTTSEGVAPVGPDDDGRDALPSVALSFMGWEMHADNNDVPPYSVRTTATIDFTDFDATSDGFRAGTFELSITIGGDVEGGPPPETFVFYVERLENEFDVDGNNNWSRTFTMGLVNK